MTAPRPSHAREAMARCPVCSSTRSRAWVKVEGSGTECGVHADVFRPSADRFGETTGEVRRCQGCGHGWVSDPPPDDRSSDAYAESSDPVSLREEPGQLATARRDLDRIEALVTPGRVLDVGCWTGSFLLAAAERGWEPVGIEPSRWASAQAAERGLDVIRGELGSTGLHGLFRLVVMTDVLEHLTDPGAALDVVHGATETDGLLFLTVPDAGSRLARLLGRRWWSVLPMHLQYFTRRSLTRLLRDHGYEPLSFSTHPKAFSVRYYAERLAGYSGAVGRGAAALVERLGLGDRLVAPDFRDRMAVVARPRRPT